MSVDEIFYSVLFFIAYIVMHVSFIFIYVHLADRWKGPTWIRMIISGVGPLIFFFGIALFFIPKRDAGPSVNPIPIPQSTGTPLALLPTPSSVPLAVTLTPSSPTQVITSGVMYADLPMRMYTGETDQVSVELKPGATEFSGTQKVEYQVRRTNGERFTYQVLIPVYPIMRAELLGAGFEIAESEIDNGKRLTQNQETVAWSWNIRAKDEGVQVLTLRMYGQEQENDLVYLVNTSSSNVDVADKLNIEKLVDLVSRNLALFCGTPIGALITFLIYMDKRRKDREEKKVATNNSIAKNDKKDEKVATADKKESDLKEEPEDKERLKRFQRPTTSRKDE